MWRQAKRILFAVALYTGWILAGAVGAIVLTLLLAFAYDPRGEGPVGNGMLFMLVFGFLFIVGIILGYLYADSIWRRRNLQE